MAGATYLETLDAFTNFLTAYVHTLLYLRGLYPRTSFVHSRFHNTSAYQSRHPLVCEWIRDAIDAVRHELLDGTVARIAVVIFSYGNSSRDSNGTGDVQIMERFMMDVSAFPVIEKEDQNAVLQWGSRPSSQASLYSGLDEDGDKGGEAKGREDTPSYGRGRGNFEASAFDIGVDTDLAEQMRAALVSLTTRCAQLKPLPEKCSFNIAMELKDEADIDPPIRHPQVWVPVQPSLQKTGRKPIKFATVEDEDEQGSTQESKDSQDNGKVGKDLGGVRFTPIRTVQTGTFRFETWIEEGRAKLEETDESGKGQSIANMETPKISLEKSKVSFSASSGDSVRR
ncbi:hypothetical protein E8E13_007950 [Curvularia kusanoi]|uniref:HORMA domain-containing protein n=1 Tax=Curvularia kusanoi TaxID=90978 RepID=A0A9P4TCZ1_CURKU|nr:hypothetical protein E8E13_007950 [Curvularia kusanoi]